MTFDKPFLAVGCLNPDQPLYGIGPGTHRFPFTVALMYWSCVDIGKPEVDTPRCLPDGLAPPLAPGNYQIVYSGTGAFGSMVVVPVTIHVAASK